MIGKIIRKHKPTLNVGDIFISAAANYSESFGIITSIKDNTISYRTHTTKQHSVPLTEYDIAFDIHLLDSNGNVVATTEKDNFPTIPEKFVIEFIRKNNTTIFNNTVRYNLVPSLELNDE